MRAPDMPRGQQDRAPRAPSEDGAESGEPPEAGEAVAPVDVISNDAAEADQIDETGDEAPAYVGDKRLGATATPAYHTGIARDHVMLAVRSQILHFRPGETVRLDPEVRALADDAGAAIDWED